MFQRPSPGSSRHGLERYVFVGDRPVRLDLRLILPPSRNLDLRFAGFEKRDNVGVWPTQLGHFLLDDQRCLGPEQGRQYFPGAAEIALLARASGDGDTGPLEPIYLRAVNFVKAPERRQK